MDDTFNYIGWSWYFRTFIYTKNGIIPWSDRPYRDMKLLIYEYTFIFNLSLWTTKFNRIATTDSGSIELHGVQYGFIYQQVGLAELFVF